MTDTAATLNEFQAERSRLFSIAYRMLGSASDAEDVVQDAWLRYRDASDVRSPRAFAATIVTRLCLDRLKSARATREQYVGPWLPEPVLTAAGEGPDIMLERSESVTLAFLLLLEALSPEERAVFVLKEAFDYDHHEIAAMLGISAANSRQLLHRAKARLKERRPSRSLVGDPSGGGEAVPSGAHGRAPSQVEGRRAVADRFAAALQSGDAAAFTELLARDVGLWADGGGKVSASRRPIFGRDAVLHFLLGLHRVAVTTGLYRRGSLTTAEVNGEPAILVHQAGRLDGVFVMSIEGGIVGAIRVVRNPDKLGFIDRQLAHARTM